MADLLHVAKFAVSSARGSGTCKLHATLMELGIKRVVLGNDNGKALAVSVVLLRKELPVIRAARQW